MSSRVQKAVAGAVLGVLLVLLPACSGTAATGGSDNVSETNYAITPATTSLKTGSVTFHVKNDSTDQTHEMVVLQTDLTGDKLPTESDGTVAEEQLKSEGEVEDLAPGESKDLTLDLAPGHYVLLCNVPGHYKLGMYKEITVTR